MYTASNLVHVGNELPLDNFTVTVPVLAVLPRAAFKVTAATMDEDDNEEDRVEVGDGGGSSNDGTPHEGHDPVGDVVGFARPCPPAGGKEAVTMRGLNVGWVLDDATRKLREGLAELGNALALHLEPALL